MKKFKNYHSPFFEFYEENQKILHDKLLSANIDETTITKVIDSGYYMHPFHENTVYDSFYAPSWVFQGKFDFNSFLKMLKNERPFSMANKKVSYVESVEDILKILNEDPLSKHCLEQGSLSFRGQKKEYTIKRDIPNLYMSDEKGNEKLIIPGIFRQYANNFQTRIIDEKPHEIFRTILADDLIYHGMEHPTILSQRNFEKYGPHTISDLQDFPEPENQEYFKRWSQIKVQGNYYPDIAIISQHYGFQSYGLDITFKPEVAAFFATNNYIIKENGKATYEPIKDGEHQGVIYCFYFRAPQIIQTRDLIESIPAFEYIFPERPIRQACALPFFLFDRLNEANQFIHHEFRLKPNFKTEGLPSKEYLFPSTEEDKFYEAAMDVKKSNKVWSDFVEYDF